MVTIVKGNEKIVCTRATFEEQYKDLGYRLASENKKEATKEVASSLDKEELSTKIDDDENDKEELSTKYGLKSKKSTTSKVKEDK